MRRTGNRFESPAIGTLVRGGAANANSSPECSAALTMAAHFPEKIEFLLNDAIGVAEYHRLGAGFDLARMPAGPHENVRGPPAEGPIRYPHPALALDHDEYGSRRASVGLRTETLRQQLKRGREGRHRRPAVRRIDIVHFESMAGIDAVHTAHVIQRLARDPVRIVE